MQKKLSRTRQYTYLSLATLILTLIVTLSLVVQFVSSTFHDPVHAAWERARSAGSYHFTADAVQTIAPTANLANVGQTVTRQDLHMKGQTDLLARTMELQMWSQSGNVLQEENSIAIKVEKGKTFMRQGKQAWEEAGDITGFFAPEGDFFSYLAGVRGLTEEDPETRDGMTFQRYSFQIDGPTYARNLRKQLEQRLQQDGELPPGVSMDMPRSYAEMQGSGELWINEYGLPVRQVLWLQFPEQNDEQVSAELKVHFSNYGKNPPVWGWNGVDMQRLAQTLSPFASYFLTLCIVLAFTTMLIVFRTSRRLRAALAVTFTVLLVVTPLLRNARVAHFGNVQTAKAAEAQEQREGGEMQRSLTQFAASQQRTPEEELAAIVTNVEMSEQQGDSGTDSDQDGLTDQQEKLFGTNPRMVDSNGDGTDDQGEYALVKEGLRQRLQDRPWYDAVNNTEDPDADDDKDGLTNGQENVLGTSTFVEDSDGDGLNDYDEVTTGITFTPRASGQSETRYLDALDEDSNDDTLGDGMECPDLNRGTCADTDGDGVPDVFDRDNDGDGVPDNEDISPFASTATSGMNQVFNQQNPLQLMLNNLQAGKMTFVEFQVRPTNPDRLWYAFNVFDWPQGDKQGNIQDVDGKTFYDLNNALPANPNNYGDMKLVPVIEITINTAQDNLPDEATLEKFGINTNTSSANSTQKQVYVPANLVTDDQTGEKVAFVARMPYMPDAGGWDKAHEVRLVWMVQMLVDVCKKTSEKDNTCDEYEQYNDSRIVQTYDEEWRLTGLSVNEDHGVDAAVLFEDPQVDENTRDDFALMQMADTLQDAFLSGREDLTIDEIQRRFHHPTNSNVPEVERWGLPNIVQVRSASYPHVDAYASSMVNEVSNDILTEHFQQLGEADPTFYPSLMYVRERRYRSLNLDQFERSTATNVTYQNGVLSLDVTEQGGEGKDAVHETTMREFNWAPFRYRGEQWESCPGEEYWNELSQRYPADRFGEVDPSLNNTSRHGFLFFLQLYYFGVLNGLSHIVQIGDQRFEFDLDKISDEALRKKVSKYASYATKYPLKAIGFVIHLVKGPPTYLGTKIKNALFSAITWLGKLALALVSDGLQRISDLVAPLKGVSNALRAAANWVGGLSSKAAFGVGVAIVVILALSVILVIIVLVVIGLVNGWFGEIARFFEENLWARIVVGSIMIMFSILMPILSFIWGVLNIILVAKTIVELAAAIESFGTSLLIGYVIGAIITYIVGLVMIVIIIGFLIYALFKYNIQPGSTEWNALWANSYVNILYTEIMMIIAVIPLVGPLILLIIGIYDTIMWITGGKTIRDTVIEAVVDLLHGVDMLAELKAVNIDANRTGMTLADAEQGLREGNTLTLKMAMAVQMLPIGAKSAVGKAYDASVQESSATRTNLRYSFSPIGENLSLLPVDSDNGWKEVDSKQSLWQKSSEVLAASKTLDRAGINSTPFAGVKLYAAYALPGRECQWLEIANYEEEGVISLVKSYLSFYTAIWNTVVTFVTKKRVEYKPFCRDYTARVTTKDNAEDKNMRPMPVGDGIILDIFPATLDKFYTLSWGGNMSFSTRQDADGDGLVAGSDPDDSRWDTDGDGLSDGFEAEQRAKAGKDGGRAFDLRKADTDQDGLSDLEEALRSTDPTSADTDQDGLTDKQEIEGWSFTYQGITTRAVSNPALADSDNDGMTDLAEKTLYERSPADYPFHPMVKNKSPIGIYATLSDADGIMAPGQTASYNVTVDNSLKNKFGIRGTATLNVPSVLGGSNQSKNFTLYTDQEVALSTNVTVAAGASSQEASLQTDVQSALNIPTSWEWQNAGTNHYTNILHSNDIAIAETPDWDAPFLVVNAEASGALVIFKMRTDGSTYQRTVPGDLADPDNPGLDIACAGDGTCFVTWCNQGVVQARRWRSDGFSTLVSAGAGFSPHIASDGSSFMLVWSEGNAVRMRRMNSAGGFLSDVQTLDTAAQANAPVDIVWAGDHYLAAWSGLNGVLQFQPIAADGSLGTRLATGNGNSPALAYDPVAKKVLASWVFRDYRDNIDARIYDPATRSLSNLFRIASGNKQDSWVYKYNDTFYRPAIVANPQHGGWLVGWGTRATETIIHSWSWWPKTKVSFNTSYQALDSQGSLRAGRQSVTWDHASTELPMQTGLACTSGAAQANRDISPCVLSSNVIPTSNDMPVLRAELHGVISFQEGITQNQQTVLEIDATPPSSQLTTPANGEFVRDTQGLIIQGEASDEHTVSSVEVSLDGGAWQAAEGSKTWTFALPTDQLAEGEHTLRIRATDLVGNVETPTESRFRVDLTPAVATVQSDIVGVQETAEGSQFVRITGTVSDPNNGSGVDTVDVLLSGQQETAGNGWQQASVTGNTWEVDYVLTAVEPTASYEVMVRTTDQVGNQSATDASLLKTIRIDATTPVADIAESVTDGVLTKQTPTLHGTLLDPGDVSSGIQGAEVSFQPLDQAIVEQDSTAMLRLRGEQTRGIPGGTKFLDSSDKGNDAACTGSSCPARVDGRNGNALSFDGSNDMLNAGNQINLANKSFTIGFWAKRNQINRDEFIVTQGPDGVAHRGLHIGFRWNNHFTCAFWANDLDTPQAYTDTDWHHWACSYDAESRERVIYRDGVKVASGIAPVNFQGYGDLIIGRFPTHAFYNGLLDDVVVYQKALPPEEIQSLMQISNLNWADANIAQQGTVQRTVHLPLNEQAGATSFADTSGNDYTATCNGNSCPTAGQPGKEGTAAAFDGNDVLNGGDSINLANRSFSIGMWAKRNGTGAYHIALSQGGARVNGGLLMGFRNTNTFMCAFYYNDLDTPPIEDNDWHHWVCSYDADTRLRTIYQDGIAVAQDKASAHYQGSGTLWIGQAPWGDAWFNGLLDDINIFPYALDTTEARTLYQQELADNLARSTWNMSLPDNLEGFYALHVRGTDHMGNRSDSRQQTEVWRGEIDTRPPRLSVVPVGSWNFYCAAEDLNIAESSFNCPGTKSFWWHTEQFVLPLEKRFNYDSAWWKRWAQGNSRLYRVESRTLDNWWYRGSTMSPSACDVYNNCNQIVTTADTGSSLADSPSLETAILEPAMSQVLTTTRELTVTTLAQGEATIAELTLTANGEVVRSANYFTDSVYLPYSGTQVLWTTFWTPPGEGQYILRTLAEDSNGLKLALDETQPMTVTVDNQPPQIALATHTLNGSLEPGVEMARFVRIPLRVSDNVGIDQVQVWNGIGWSDSLSGTMELEDGTSTPWSVMWNTPSVEVADGGTYTVTVRAQDVAGHTTQVTEEITADLRIPEAVTMTLRAGDTGNTQVITAGTTIRTESPELVMEWTASKDGSGIASYQAGWTTSNTPDVAALTTYAADAQRQHTLVQAQEAQVYYAHLIITDQAGNTRSQTVGPVYVDSPQTPDIVTEVAASGETLAAEYGGTGASLTASGALTSTPDLSIVSDYAGWIDNGCSLVGTDRSLVRNARERQTLTGTQQLNMTWDAHALRFAWTGADFSQTGDLFIYLDTGQAGGALRAFNPYPTLVVTPTVNPTKPNPQPAATDNLLYLPLVRQQPGDATGLNTSSTQAAAQAAQAETRPPKVFTLKPRADGGIEPVMAPWQTTQDAGLAATAVITDGKLPQIGLPFAADYVVWITDTTDIQILRWEGSKWVDVAPFTARNYASFDSRAQRTDVAIPFRYLGISNPDETSLQVLALASEEDALQLWASAPAPNPLNSPLVLNPALEDMVNSSVFTLSRHLTLESLRQGTCPSAGRFSGAEVRARITADPSGLLYSFLNDGLFFLMGELFSQEGDFETELLSYLDRQHPPVVPGQEVSYTLHYENVGTGTAPEAFIAVIVYEPLRVIAGDYETYELDDGTILIFRIGDLEPGMQGTVSFTALVDPALDTKEYPRASMDMLFYDAMQWANDVPIPYEWLWSDHEIDRSGPADVRITAPQTYVAPGEVTIEGQATDPLGVPDITLAIVEPSGNERTVDCTDETATDGMWRCGVDIGDAQHGEQYRVRVQAADAAGQRSAWTAWKTLQVDTLTPTVVLEDGGALESNNGMVRPENARISGRVEDDGQAAALEVCEAGEETCVTTSLPPGRSATWVYELPVADEADGEVRSLGLYGLDVAGNRSTNPLTMTYLADVMSPVLTVTHQLETISQEEIAQGTPVLSGIVSDGGGVQDIYVHALAADGTPMSIVALHDESGWRVIPGLLSPGRYTLTLEPQDYAGNGSVYGPYEVEITP